MLGLLKSNFLSRRHMSAHIITEMAFSWCARMVDNAGLVNVRLYYTYK